MTCKKHGSQCAIRYHSNRYDHLGRRVQKITPGATHTYFYDGWLLVKEIVANVDESRSVIEYHWGKDLSGTIGGAGGVGGLLYLTITNSSTPNSSTRQLYVPYYDAYGNVMGYYDAQGNVVAEYTYDAFGKLIASSGPIADVFSIRYSTKYFDPETGFYYYGYRFYSPDLMRWITRDPIGEDGGVNLYAMCRNSPIDAFDALGLWRMISGAYLVQPDSAKRPEYKYAMKILQMFDDLNKLRDNYGRRIFNAKVKDMVVTPIATIRKEIDNNSENVFLVAHGGLTVNGKVWRKRKYVWNASDVVVESLDIFHDGRPMMPLSSFGQNLKMSNVYACYVASWARKIRDDDSGLIESSQVLLDDSINRLYNELKRRYVRSVGHGCTVDISIYEGERNRPQYGQSYGTKEAFLYWEKKSLYNKEGGRKWWED